MAIYQSQYTGPEIDEAIGKVSTIEQNVITNTEDITTLEEELSTVNQNITDLGTDINTVAQNLSTHTSDNTIHHTLEEIKTDLGIDETNGSVINFLNEQGDFIQLPSVQHSNTTDKNAEQSFQHIDNSVNTETTLTSNDKLAFYSNTLLKFVTITIPNFLIWIKAQLDSYFQLKNIIVNNTAILTGDWVADTTYPSYGYKVVITINGVTSSMLAEVTLGHTESISGNYSPICVTGTNSVTIYSKVNTGITIPTILIQK